MTDKSVLKPEVDPTATATPVDADAPQPDIDKTASAFDSMRSLSISMAVLTTLAVFYTLYFARAFLLPIAFAVLLNFLFSPFVRWMSRFRIPHALGAGIVILGLIGTIALAGYELTSPVQHWASQAPTTMRNAELKLRKVIRPLQNASKTAEQVASAASASTETTPTGKTVPTPVVVQGPTLLAKAFGTTTKAAAAILEVVILLFFLLASGDLFLQKLIKVLPNLGEKRKAVQIARETESSISRYLLTAALINTGEAAIVTGVMYLFHMPSPFLWGALVMCLEFIPYLGAFVMCVILTVAAITTFDNVGHALLVPMSFLFINLVQGNLVSPMLLGHRLSLNPVAIFVGLAFWFTVWGIPGAFVAVPLLAAFKIFCDHIESLASVGEFLGRRDNFERRATIREDEAPVTP
jgi:predicted PurR-regulated permease PerM